MSDIPVYAHRGLSKKYLENSLKSFEKAIELGVDGIELDLQLSADGVPFVTHDIDFFRLAGNPKRITDIMAEDVLKLKLGKAFFRRFFYSRVLTFDQFIQLIRSTDIKLNIELKESFLGKKEKVEEVVYKCSDLKDVHFSSFEWSILETIQQMDLGMETAFIGKKYAEWDYVLSNTKLNAVHLNKKYYGTPLMERIWNAGFPLRFYNIKGNESYIENPHQAVIGWITDFPLEVMSKQNRNA